MVHRAAWQKTLGRRLLAALACEHRVLVGDERVVHHIRAFRHQLPHAERRGILRVGNLGALRSENLRCEDVHLHRQVDRFRRVLREQPVSPADQGIEIFHHHIFLVGDRAVTRNHLRVERIVLPAVYQQLDGLPIGQGIVRRRKRQFRKDRPVGIRVRKERQELPIPGPFRKLPDKTLCPFVGSEVYPRVKHQLEPVQRRFVILLGKHPVRQKHRDKEEQFPIVNRSRRPPAEIDRRRRIGFRNDAARQVTVFEQRLRQIPGLPVARRVVAEIDAEIVVVVTAVH